MPRFRALVLLGLFLVNQAACYSWQAPKVTPQEYVTQHPNKKVRVTAKDEQGKSQSSVVLKGVRFSEDSVFGSNKKDQPIAYSLREVGTIKVRRVDGVGTAFLILLVAVPLALGVMVAFAFSDDSGDYCC
jgi:hypothetical protein